MPLNSFIHSQIQAWDKDNGKNNQNLNTNFLEMEIDAV